MDSLIKIIKCDSNNINSYRIKFLQNFTYSEDLNKSTRERTLLDETLKLVQKKKTVLYALQINNGFLGLITLSASSIDETPVVQIDYLFVDYNFRKIVVEDIKDTVSNYLIDFDKVYRIFNIIVLPVSFSPIKTFIFERLCTFSFLILAKFLIENSLIMNILNYFAYYTKK